jgi:outer membrane protein insertion porin family
MAGASHRRKTALRTAGSLSALPLLGAVLIGAGQARAAESSPAPAETSPTPDLAGLLAMAPSVPAQAGSASPAQGDPVAPLPAAALPAAPPTAVAAAASAAVTAAEPHRPQPSPGGSAASADPTILAQAAPTPAPAGSKSAPASPGAAAPVASPKPASTAPVPAGTTPPAPATPGAASPGAAEPSPADGAAPPAGPGSPFTPSPFNPVPTTPAPQAEPAAAEPDNEPRVLLSEVVVQGLDGHPERQRLEQAVYGAMTVIPGSRVTRTQLRKDLAAIYATGWFSDARMQPKDGPLGVRLIVTVSPYPVLTKVVIEPADAKLPVTVVNDTFASDYGRSLNLNTLQTRMQELQKWYSDQGFSLARVTGPGRIGPDGSVQLLVRQGTVSGVEVQFLDKEGSSTDANGKPIRGKTKPWVITREISLKPGQVFNRRNLEDDIKRLYGTGLFSDVKVTLRPQPDDPGQVAIVLGVVEQSTGSLSGGLGYSQSQGVFGQIQVQDSNLLGRAWDLATSFTYGQFGGLFDITFTDPWIKGDPYRTAMRIKAFISRDVPQVFQSQNNGNIYTVSEFYEAPGANLNDLAYNIQSKNNPVNRHFDSVQDAVDADPSSSWFNYDGNTVVVQRIGGNLQFVRPLNGGNPFKRAPWSVIVGMSGQQVRPMNVGGETMPYGAADTNDGFDQNGNLNVGDLVCIAYNCATRNQLLAVRLATTYNTLDDPRNPTRGDFFSFGTEQFVSVGPDSPTFNRVRGSYTHFIPVNWLKIFKGCRTGASGTAANCKQAVAFQVSAGTVMGNLPPYEAFCLGGGNSVRGYYDCDLGVGRSFGEATLEYRFPLFSIVSGELFVDGGTTFGTQNDVPGNLGTLLGKPGEGFSVGTGLIVTTPVGPLRLEVASEDLSGSWRFNLGVGWKF